MVKISYAGCLGLSPAMLKCALHPKIAINLPKTPFGGFKVV